MRLIRALLAGQPSADDVMHGVAVFLWRTVLGLVVLCSALPACLRACQLDLRALNAAVRELVAHVVWLLLCFHAGRGRGRSSRRRSRAAAAAGGAQNGGEGSVLRTKQRTDAGEEERGHSYRCGQARACVLFLDPAHVPVLAFWRCCDLQAPCCLSREYDPCTAVQRVLTVCASAPCLRPLSAACRLLLPGACSGTRSRAAGDASWATRTRRSSWATLGWPRTLRARTTRSSWSCTEAQVRALVLDRGRCRKRRVRAVVRQCW